QRDRLVDQEEKIGEFLANRTRLRTGQIRKFVDAVTEIKSEGTQEKEANFFRSQCLLLKPKLAYAAGCQEEVKPLMAVLVPCLDRVHNKDDLLRFYRLLASIITYY